jgi:hypothetical protein
VEQKNGAIVRWVIGRSLQLKIVLRNTQSNLLSPAPVCQILSAGNETSVENAPRCQSPPGT